MTAPALSSALAHLVSRSVVELAAAHDKHGIGGRPRRDLDENLGPGSPGYR